MMTQFPAQLVETLQAMLFHTQLICSPCYFEGESHSAAAECSILRCCSCRLGGGIHIEIPPQAQQHSIWSIRGRARARQVIYHRHRSVQHLSAKIYAEAVLRVTKELLNGSEVDVSCDPSLSLRHTE
jgi:hypothetical protein